MEPAKLPHPYFESSLRRSPLAHYSHRRFRNSLLAPARLSARLLSLFPRRSTQRAPLSTRNRPTVGQLSRPRLRLENNSRQRRCPQRLLAVSPHHTRASQRLTL